MSLVAKHLTKHKSNIFDLNRRITAHATSIGWSNTPHATYLYEPDITDFYKYYQDNRTDLEDDHPITFTVVMLKAIAESLKETPKLNAILHYNRGTKVGTHHHLKEISITIPYLLSDKRMIAPTLHNAGEKTLHQIAESLQDLKRRVCNTDIDAMQYVVAKHELMEHLKHFKLGVIRQIFHTKVGKNKVNITKQRVKDYLKMPDKDKITAHDIFNTSVLVSNLGSVFREQRGGITLLDLVSPQVFAVAINAIQDRPGVYTEDTEQKIGIRKILPLSLTIDHRALDGADFVPFQNQLDKIFARPSIISEW